jgi:hypothetical protein
MSEAPKVLILMPVKNAAAYLPRYVERIDALDWHRELPTLGMGVQCWGLPDLEVLHYPD